MPENPAHFGFILASYLVTAAVLIGLVLWIVLDGRAQRRRLIELESRGVRRRSAGAEKPKARGGNAVTGTQT
jgi:heme exporter protein D